MKCVKFKDCLLHDGRIKFIDFNDDALVFHILDTPYMDFVNFKAKLFLESEDSFRIAYIKQYPLFHKVKFKGKEISPRQLESIFKKGKILEIVDFYVSVDTDALIITTDVFPYSRKGGVYEKLIFTIDYKFDYLNILDG